jgi:CheY-like chemotaxis protein
MQLFGFGVSPALVVCNVRLPDRPGHALHADLDTKRPGLGARFAFVTDGVLSPDVASYLMTSGRPTLRRPIDLDQVKALALTPPDPQRAPTVPAMLAARVVDDGGSLAGSHGALRAAMREQELDTVARAVADTLRREGPKRGVAVGAMLRDRGLSEPEALSVLSFALSRRIVVRDPPPSTLLRAPDVDVARTVLVVDDDFDLRQTLREVLEDEGYEVDTAANGREALDRIVRTHPPRVVVLDLMMPVMDGFRVLDELARHASLSRIPVVVISAGRTGLRGAGAHEFLSKPLDYHKLVATIDRSMRLGAVPP